MIRRGSVKPLMYALWSDSSPFPNHHPLPLVMNTAVFVAPGSRLRFLVHLLIFCLPTSFLLVKMSYFVFLVSKVSFTGPNQCNKVFYWSFTGCKSKGVFIMRFCIKHWQPVRFIHLSVCMFVLFNYRTNLVQILMNVSFVFAEPEILILSQNFFLFNFV